MFLYKRSTLFYLFIFLPYFKNNIFLDIEGNVVGIYP